MNLFDLLHPVIWADFQAGIQERSALLIRRNDPRYYDGFMAIEDLVARLVQSELKAKDIKLAKDNKRLNISNLLDAFQSPEELSQGIFRAVRNGHTLVYHSCQRILSEVHSLIGEFERVESGYNNVGSNLYWSPSSSSGFARHSDEHDVFILQIHGQKNWEVDGRVMVYACGEAIQLMEPSPHTGSISLEVMAGDLLYMPEGFYHRAFTSHSDSLHVTIGGNRNRLCE